MHCYSTVISNMDRKCTRTGFEVGACMASSPYIRKKNLFHKLISCDTNVYEKYFRGSVPSTEYF